MKFEVRETVLFFRSRIPSPPGRLLEVGCGAGEVAAELVRSGYSVVALDADSIEVAKARALGIDAQTVHWPDLTSEQTGSFDAVLFTRSLHHMERLAAAVARARAVLRAGGYLLVEDFAFAAASPPTVTWLQGVLRLLEAAGTIDAVDNSFVSRLIRANDPVEVWQHEHVADHHIHSAAAMQTALEAEVILEVVEEIPYLYRYVAQVLSQDRESLLRRVFDEERALIADGVLSAVGRRFVAKRQSPNT